MGPLSQAVLLGALGVPRKAHHAAPYAEGFISRWRRTGFACGCSGERGGRFESNGTANREHFWGNESEATDGEDVSMRYVEVDWPGHARHQWIGEEKEAQHTLVGRLIRVEFGNGDSGLYDPSRLRDLHLPHNDNRRGES